DPFKSLVGAVVLKASGLIGSAANKELQVKTTAIKLAKLLAKIFIVATPFEVLEAVLRRPTVVISGGLQLSAFALALPYTYIQWPKLSKSITSRGDCANMPSSKANQFGHH
ncbi:MAG: hypothetical protein ACO3F3_08060, partial [Gemmataceae bacterium]